MLRRMSVNIGLFFLTILGLFGLVVSSVHAYHHIVHLSVPTGNAQGGTYQYDNQVDKIYTNAGSAGTQYYISVHGRVWGQCSPDMTDCTFNRWKVKDETLSSKWWSQSTDYPHINSRGLYGIGVARHSIIHRPGYSTVSDETSEHGKYYSDGANTSCFYDGPDLHADTITGLPCP